MIGFKVVRKVGQVLISTFVSAFRSASLVYAVGSTVKPRPNCGPIAVFDSLHNAEKYLIANFYTTGDYKIYECEYTPSDKRDMWYSYQQCDGFVRVVKGPLDFMPAGTVLAESVTLIGKVETI